MIIICPRLGNRIDRRSPASAKFCRIRVCLNLKLLERVYVRDHQKGSIRIIIVVYSIQKKVVEVASGAVLDEGSNAADRIPVSSDGCINHAHGQAGELDVIASIQGKVSHGLG